MREGTKWEIREGDALERLCELPDESVHCCVTSPPYWGLRDYGVEGQLGLEPTPEEYIAEMVEVFAEVRRVLRGDGTCWVNIGDSYARFASGRNGNFGRAAKGVGMPEKSDSRKVAPGLKQKDLVGIPWMLAFALRADGWYLRRDIIWSKPNPMPESVQDRPTSAHEYLLLLTKSARYFYDAEAIREPATYAEPHSPAKSPYGQGFRDRSPEQEKTRRDKQRGHVRRHDGFNGLWDSMSKEEQRVFGRNKRSVWTIATRPYPEAHFATFPPDLVEPCILAGSPARTCGQCGAPWSRQVERTVGDQEAHDRPKHLQSSKSTLSLSGNGSDEWAARGGVTRTIGWQPTCEHGDDSGRALVLDPFSGAATTGLVSAQLDRDFVGIELNPEYAEMGRRRIRRWEVDPSGSLGPPPKQIKGQIGMEIEG